MPPGVGMPPLALLSVVAALTAAPGAHAAAQPEPPTCAESVIDDWSGNGRVDDAYAIACYRDALDALPEDVRVYTSAVDDISRALRERITTRGPVRRLQSAAPSATASAPLAAVPAAEAAARRSPPVPLLLVAATVVAAAAVLLVRVRRRWRGA